MKKIDTAMCDTTMDWIRERRIQEAQQKEQKSMQRMHILECIGYALCFAGIGLSLTTPVQDRYWYVSIVLGVVIAIAGAVIALTMYRLDR